MTCREKKTRRLKGLRLALLATSLTAAAICSAPAHAQGQTVSLRGRVTVEGVAAADEVVAINVRSGFRRTVDVRSDGSYNFASLPPGRYRLELATPDGVRRTDEFTLRVGQDATFDYDFTESELAAGEDVIIVTGDRIRTIEGGEVGVDITPELIDSLPQNNRNFLAFADLAPGVAFEVGANGAARIQGGAQDSRTVNVFIDGVGQKDFVLKNGITGQDSSPGNPFPQSAIGEYRVITQNYKAEFDQVSSAAVTAISKSGTNELHGDVFFDFTNESLRAKTPIEKDGDLDKTETRDMQWGASIGGPIIKDVMHFFFAYEGKRIRFPVEVTPGGGVDVSFFPSEFQGEFGQFNRDFDEDLFFGKIDFSPTDQDLFEITVKVREESGLRWDNGPNAASFTHAINNDEIRGLLRWEHTANTWINDAKLTYEDSAWNPQPEIGEDGLGQNAMRLQLATGETILNVGGHPNFQDKGQKGWGFQDDFTYTGINNHTFKAGVKVKWATLETLQQNNFNAQYFFNTELNGPGTFNTETPFRVLFGLPVPGVGDGTARSENFQFGVYLQDDWDVTDRLTVNLGVRWDFERTPLYTDFVTPDDVVTALTTWPNIQNTDYDIMDYISTGSERENFFGAIQPRIGFSYDLTPDGVYVLFGGYGRSYDRNQFDFIQRESAGNTFRTITFNFDTGDPAHPVAPGTPTWDPIFFTPEGREQLAANADFGGREISLLNNDLKIPFSDQFSIGLRARYDWMDIEVGFSHVRARDGFVSLLGNRREDGSFFAPGAISGPPFGFSPPGFGNVIISTNGIESNANLAYLKLTRAHTEADPWGFNLTYTYTDAEENRKFGEVFSLDFPSIEDYPFLTSAGVSKHRIVSAGSADLPLGIRLSAKLTLASPPFIFGFGMPGDDVNQRAPRVIRGNNKRPFIVGNFWAERQLDLALTKYFPLSFVDEDLVLRGRIDVINVFDYANFTNYVGNGTDPNFGEVANLGIGGNLPRTIKLSVGMSF